MIDIHVHCRDEEEHYKESIAHALGVADRAGLSAIFDMPNTKIPVINFERVNKRLELALETGSSVFYGTHVGLTSDSYQIEEAVACYLHYFPDFEGPMAGVVGLKMFAGESVGNLSIKDPEKQLFIYNRLSRLQYTGVLVVHCEKESEMHPELWKIEDPITHSYARPEKCEVEAIKDQIDFAIRSNYRGKLHIAHVSTPESVMLVKDAKNKLQITCGVTPHHLLLNNQMMKGSDGMNYKVNPSLRDPNTQAMLFECFKGGLIDTSESDHAPHSHEDKNIRHMSGIPWLALWPVVIDTLVQKGADRNMVYKMMNDNVNRLYGTNLPVGNLARLVNSDDVNFYSFNPSDRFPVMLD